MNRPQQLIVWIAAFFAAAAMFEARGEEPKAGSSMIVYVGTYTGPKSKGIYTMKLDGATGALSKPEVAAEVASPSFFTVHPSNRFLYAIGELGQFQGKKGGAVSAFSIDQSTGKLTMLNQQSSGGAGPCFVGLDPTGKVALVANYGGGSVESLPIKDDGSLGEPATFIQHEGSSANKQRQAEPHAHSINASPDGRFAIAADLGLDKLLVYKIDAAKGAIGPNDPPSTSIAPGSGPRHFVFHPNGKFAYNCNEMGMTATAFSYDAEKGTLTQIQMITTLPADQAPSNKFSTAEIQAHPSGKFIYVSNRGHDTLAIFTVDEATGKLTAAGHTSCGGKTPRNFRIDPTGNWLLAANQDSGNIVVFRIDQKTGGLSATGVTVEVGSPVCIKFLDVAR